MTPHDAHDLTADFPFDDGPPRHEAEAEPVIDHGEASAGELSCADQPAADGLAVLDWPEAETSFRGKFLAYPLDLLTLECRQKIVSSPQAPALSAPGMALSDQFLLAPFKRISDLGAKAGISESALFAMDQLPVKPGGAIARDLAVEIVGRDHPHIRFAAMGGIVGLGAGLEIIRNPPAVSIDPLDNAGAA